ncbi:probable DNA helicase MCM8 isoform X4 [Triticum aestivum]|uniref:probable DNA helicase MCM8 isoform X4 n=1 Tax=Triticum aestivum TaxID=4565 RepID=UPI001D003196|nr:probable DNA helicase MCM8 isoform X4 [Triticum aestivum]
MDSHPSLKPQKFRSARLQVSPPPLLTAQIVGEDNPRDLLRMYADTQKGRPGCRPVDASRRADLAVVWPRYFPEETEHPVPADDPRARLVGDLVKVMGLEERAKLLPRVEDDGVVFFLPIDFQQLKNLCGGTNLLDALRENPKEALLCMGVAVHLAKCLGNGLQLSDVDKVNIRLYNHTETIIALKNLKAAYIKKLATVRGTVVKVSTVKPLVLALEFQCTKCATVIRRVFSDGKFSPPVSCIIQGCKGRTFTPVRSTAKLIDFQKIRIQELSSAENREEGRVPRTIECELTEDLVDCCIPGEVVTVAGIVKVLNNYMDVGGAGITLALFGAVQKHSMDQNKVPIRGDIHVIIVGDPGLGKSQLLKAAASVSPRGIYVCGNTTTNAGLTVAVVKDSMTNDYAFEAGAMVLADRGLCCIDEFDKMSAEYQSLLEAMEQQCVSVAKAGLVASLSARTSVLAAANPVGGHYDRGKTVNENLKMNAALLSRFDLVFILLDQPDLFLDKRVSDHIMALHTNDRSPCSSNKRLRTVPQFNGSMGIGIDEKKLASRLRLHQEKDRDFVPLPEPLLRKYISYARSYVTPRMSEPAAVVLRKYYLNLRAHSTCSDGTPITARQLESLVRLAEARARVDLREEVTEQDANDVVEIMNESLYDKYVDEHGCVDYARSGGMSQQKEAKRLMSALNKQSELQQKDHFSRAEIRSLADKISLQVPDLDDIMEKLNSAGYIVHKGQNIYQILTSSCSRTQPTRSRCSCFEVSSQDPEQHKQAIGSTGAWNFSPSMCRQRLPPFHEMDHSDHNMYCSSSDACPALSAANASLVPCWGISFVAH